MVVVIEEWPIHSEMVGSGTPAMAVWLPKVWRREGVKYRFRKYYAGMQEPAYLNIKLCKQNNAKKT